MSKFLRALVFGLAISIGTVGVTTTLGGCGAYKAFVGGESEQDVLTAIAASRSLAILANKTIGELADAEAASPGTLDQMGAAVDTAQQLIDEAERALPNVQAALAKLTEADEKLDEVRDEQADIQGQ